MLDKMQSGFAKMFGVLGAVLVSVGSLTFAAWIAIDLMNLDGFLGYSVITLTAGAFIFAIAMLLNDRASE